MSWYAEIKGLNEVIGKLSRLEQENFDSVLDEIKEETERVVKQGVAENGFPVASQYVDVKKSKGKLDVGLHSSNFENWKHVWFQNFGYHQFYYGHDTGKKTVVHVGFFNNVKAMAASQVKPVLEQRIKRRVDNIMR